MAFFNKDILKVAVTGAAGQISYALLPMISRGNMLGEHQKLDLRLLDIAPALTVMKGVQMELVDCAFPLLTNVTITADARTAFDGCDVIVMCGAFPRKAGMERADLLQRNAHIFSEQGRIIGEVANKDCRVLVVGNPANTNALILSTAARGKIDPTHITSLARLDHNRAVSQAANRAHVPLETVKNVIVWGNHSPTMVPDVNNAVSGGKTIRELAKDDAYFDGEFIPLIQQRGTSVIKARGKSSAASAAKAIVDQMHDWVFGTRAGEHVSMSVFTNGNSYGIPENLYFSLPLTCSAGTYKVVEGVHVSDKIKMQRAKTIAELVHEREMAGIKTPSL